MSRRTESEAEFDRWFKSFSDAEWEDVNAQQAFLAGHRLASAALSASQERERVLADFARYTENSYDHDEDAHKHGTPCVVCEARSALSARAALQSPPTPAPEPAPTGWCAACRAWKRAGIPHDCAATPAPESEPKCGPPLCSGCGVATGCGPKGCRHCDRARAALSKSQKGER